MQKCGRTEEYTEARMTRGRKNERWSWRWENVHLFLIPLPPPMQEITLQTHARTHTLALARERKYLCVEAFVLFCHLSKVFIIMWSLWLKLYYVSRFSRTNLTWLHTLHLMKTVKEYWKWLAKSPLVIKLSINSEVARVRTNIRYKLKNIIQQYTASMYYVCDNFFFCSQGDPY